MLNKQKNPMTISQWLNRLLFVLLEKQTDLSKLDKFNFSKQEEIKVVRNHLKEAFLVFKKNAIEDGNPVMCKIHDSFRTREMVDHNCLGCNFADSTWLIHNFLRTYRHQREIKHAYSTLIILAYFLVERIDEFFKIIKLEEPYRRENFKILVEIRRWANFLKHPKAFLLTHHPVFSFENSSKNEELVKNANEVINQDFVDVYYVDKKKDNELFKKLENKENILVVFPDAIRLVERLCEAMNKCVEVIQDNPVYRSVVEERTTFRDYWVNSQEPIE